ncbi:hypothetical protein QZH41_015146 [Actinostola sp. cb2023]|nr:hypothetical protein QZH41_015146 [Actinostola sp. cb2023]
MNIFWIIVIFASTHLPRAEAKCKAPTQFIRHHNEALLGHVIKTIAANHIECTMACGNFIGCRSVNFYEANGKEMCDLNKSSKSADPSSMVSRTGYEYDELTTRDGCSSEQCLGSYDWHVFNSSQFRLFENRATWGKARSTCRAHQGDLVSIFSQREQDFISETLLNDAPKGNFSDTQLIMLWKLDGTDVALSLHGNAAIKSVDGYKALYLDGNSANYATTPKMNLHYHAFTVGAWVKLLTPTSEGLVYGDWSSPYKFGLQIDKDGKVSIKIMFRFGNVTTLTSKSSITFNTWTHVLSSWLSSTHAIAIFIDGKKDTEETLTIAGREDLMVTGHAHHDIGLNRNASQVLHGYIRELTVFTWAAPIEAVAAERIGRWRKMAAVWTGLNDLSTENTFTFSDGSHMSYHNWLSGDPNNRFRYEDCVGFSMLHANHMWMDLSCGNELPFICRKKANA